MKKLVLSFAFAASACGVQSVASDRDNAPPGGDPTSSAGDAAATNGDTTATNGDPAATNGDPAATNGDPAAAGGDAAVEPPADCDLCGDGGPTAGDASGAGDGGLSGDATVDVPPVLTTFQATPANVLAGVATDITWTFSYAEPPQPEPTCDIDQGVGQVSSGAVTSVTQSGDTTYTLVCSNSAGSDAATTLIAASAAPTAPVLASFAATPASFGSGRPVTVTWTWSYANAPSPTPTCSIDQGVGAIANGGSSSVTLAGNTTFTLSCANSEGSDTASVTLTVATCNPYNCRDNDGCCRVPCESSNDSDCTNDCGNRIREEWEPCDDGNTTTPPCPYGRLSCTVCNPDCTTSPGSTSYCGDNRIDATNGETCDGNCPTVCADLDTCTADALSGSGCTTVCGHTAVSACSAGDGCCPSGCAGSDPDCACTRTGLEVPDDGRDNDCVGGDLAASDAVGVFVAKSGADANPGTMAAPKLTIAAAMTVAQSAGKSVFVAAGVYDETVAVSRSLFGGYEASAWSRDPTSQVTEVRALTIGATATRAVAVDGFIVRAGSFPCDAIVVNGSGVAAQISHNRIIAGSCLSGGGAGIDVNRATVAITNNVIHGGGGRSHIGVSVQYLPADAWVVNNYIFAGTTNNFSAAAEVLYDARAVFANNIMDSGDGTWHAEPEVVVEIDPTIELTLINNAMWRAGGPTCLVDDGDRPCVSSLATVNACSWPGCVAAGGNFTTDPQVAGSFPNYSLGATSPCRDAGIDPATVGPTLFDDLLGASRPQGAGYEVGPFELAP